MKKFLSRTFNIHEGEHARVALSLAILLIVMTGIMLGRNARDSIFLKNVGVAYLPYMYLLNAVFVVMTSLVYAAFVDKVDRIKLMVASFALYAGMAVLMRLMLSGPGLKAFSAVCYVIVQIMWLVGLMQFWTFMGDVFDARESKRLFPVISSGGLLGMVIAGLGGKYLIDAVGGTENLFLVWAVMLAAGIVPILALRASSSKKGGKEGARAVRAPARPAPKKSQVQDFKEGYEYLKSSGLLKTMAFINLSMWIVFTIVDYIFNWQVKNKFGADKDAMTAYLGLFRAGAGFLCLIVQLGFTSRIVSRFGVGRTIAVHPAFMALATLGVSLKGGFAVSNASKFGDHVLLYTLQDSSYQMLYNPVPPEKRGRARAFVEGYIKPVSMGLAGLILIVAVLALGSGSSSLAAISWVSFAAALAWAFFSFRANGGYVEALTSNLGAGDLHLRAAAMSHLSRLNDEANLRVLRGALKGGDREMTAFALEMIQSLGVKEAVAEVRDLLSDALPEIRAAAIDTLAELGDRETLRDVAAGLQDRDADVRQAAVRAIGKLRDDGVLQSIVPLLEDEKRKVRAEAVTALVRAGGLDGILLAGDILKKMLSSEDPEDRMHAADVLGSLKIKHFASSLLGLAADPSEKVRARAVKALAKIEDPRAVGVLIEALADKKTLRHARKGLEALGVKAFAALRDAAFDEGRDRFARRSAAALIGKIPGRDSENALAGLLKAGSAAVRGAAVEALSDFKWDEEGKIRANQVIHDYIDFELERLGEARHAASFFMTRGGERKPPPVFTDALEELAAQALERAFKALSIVLDRSTALGIWAKLKSDDSRLKPLALEALENIGEKDLTRKIIPLFEERSPEEAERFYRSQGPALDERELYERRLADPSSWIRGCAAYSVGVSGNAGLVPVIEKLFADPDAFVSETARWAALQFNGGKREAENMLTMEKILFLKSAPIFAGMSGEELRALANIVEEVRIKEGDVIFYENDPGEALYVIVSGKVRAIRGEVDKGAVLATLGERDCLGEMAILDDEPRSATAQAAEDALLLKIDRDDFRELLREEPEVAFGIFRVFTRRIRQSNLEQEQHAFAPMQGSV